jgi:SAM-dependent methyltransferase
MSHYSWQGDTTRLGSLLEGVDFTLYECVACALIFQKMAPVPEMLGIIYDEFINPAIQREHERQTLTLDNFSEIAIGLKDLFARTNKHPKDIRLLDYGCGYGRWARVAVAMGAQVFATEISPDKIAFARSIGVQIISDDDLRRDSFDIIHAESVFEHLVDPLGVFDRLAATLTQHGIIKIGVPRQGRIRPLIRKHGMIDWSPWTYQFKRRRFNAYNTVMPLEHLQSFSVASIKLLAKRAGMTVSNGCWGWYHVDLNIGSRSGLLNSSRALAKRGIKDFYAAIRPGLRDTGYYVLRRES